MCLDQKEKASSHSLIVHLKTRLSVFHSFRIHRAAPLW